MEVTYLSEDHITELVFKPSSVWLLRTRTQEIFRSSKHPHQVDERWPSGISGLIIVKEIKKQILNSSGNSPTAYSSER